MENDPVYIVGYMFFAGTYVNVCGGCTYGVLTDPEDYSHDPIFNTDGPITCEGWETTLGCGKPLDREIVGWNVDGVITCCAHVTDYESVGTVIYADSDNSLEACSVCHGGLRGVSRFYAKQLKVLRDMKKNETIAIVSGAH